MLNFRNAIVLLHMKKENLICQRETVKTTKSLQAVESQGTPCWMQKTNGQVREQIRQKEFNINHTGGKWKLQKQEGFILKVQKR